MEKEKKERKGEIDFLKKKITYYNFILSRKKEKDNSPIKMAARNTTLWEARINMMDTSRKQYRLEKIIFSLKSRIYLLK